MPNICQKCKKEIIWLTALPTVKNPNPRPNPVEARPHENGNLVIDRKQGVYRFATKTEIEVARRENKNLYISHFSNCPFSKDFKSKEKK